MFDHVYCLQPSAADNPGLNKLLVIPRWSGEGCPHLFRNDSAVRSHRCGLNAGRDGERGEMEQEIKEKIHNYSEVTNDL